MDPLTIVVLILLIANLLTGTHNYLKHRSLEKNEILVHLASIDLWEVAELVGRVDDELAESIYRRVNNAQDKLARVRL
jgi:hypothetical protein